MRTRCFMVSTKSRRIHPYALQHPSLHQFSNTRIQRQQQPPLTLLNCQTSRLFGTRRKRSHPTHGKSDEYWDKEYVKSKLRLESISKTKIVEPKNLNDVISWKVLVVMAVSPLAICLVVPELREKMFESFPINDGHSHKK